MENYRSEGEPSKKNEAIDDQPATTEVVFEDEEQLVDYEISPEIMLNFPVIMKE